MTAFVVLIPKIYMGSKFPVGPEHALCKECTEHAQALRALNLKICMFLESVQQMRSIGTHLKTI